MKAGALEERGGRKGPLLSCKPRLSWARRGQCAGGPLHHAGTDQRRWASVEGLSRRIVGSYRQLDSRTPRPTAVDSGRAARTCVQEPGAGYTSVYCPPSSRTGRTSGSPRRSAALISPACEAPCGYGRAREGCSGWRSAGWIQGSCVAMGSSGQQGGFRDAAVKGCYVGNSRVAFTMNITWRPASTT